MTAAATQVRTCLDCPAEVTGGAKRCPTCQGIATRKAGAKRQAKHRARKKQGLVVPKGANTITASQTETFLADYDMVCDAVAHLVDVPEADAFATKAEAVRVFAKRAKNRKLEIDALRARVTAERRLGAILQDMEARGELRSRGRPEKSSNSEHLPKTLSEVGVDRKLSMSAKALAAMPDFEPRIKDWYAHQCESQGRVSINLLKTGKQASDRKAGDAYYTPISMFHEAAARWKPQTSFVNDDGQPVIWDPCCGDGRPADVFEAAGYATIRGDIQTGEDFFEITQAPSPILATNPPFKQFDDAGKEISARDIRGFIDHAFAIGVEEIFLIIPERLFACAKGREQFERRRPALFAMMDWREDYLGKGGDADRMLAVAIWDSPHRKTLPAYDIWSRENQPEGDGEQ